jgi:hypothetical protein
MRVGVGSLVMLFVCSCGSRGEVTFVLHDAADARMRPDPTLVTEYLIKAGDGSVVGVASVNAQSQEDRLPLGVLMTTAAPRDLVIDVLSGTVLLGRARVRDVAIKAGTVTAYDAEIRKPLVFVGFQRPDEPDGQTLANATEILDPTTAADLAHPRGGTAVPIAGDVLAGAATADGRFFLAGRPAKLTVFDTGSAAAVGDVRLAFTPRRVAVAARDTAAAVVGANGEVSIFTNVAALTSDPASASPAASTTVADSPRAAAFSPDGQRLYVLSGGAGVLDPCDGATPTANAVQIVGVDGSDQGTWTLPEFAADLAVEPSTGAVLISLSAANQVASIDAASPAGAVSPTNLFAAACPAALRATGGLALAVSGGLDSAASMPAMRYRDLVQGSSTQPTSKPTLIPFPETFLDQPDPGTTSGPNFDQILRVTPRSQAGYELTVTPDATRAVFAARSHYVVSNGDLGFANCKAFIDAVEYGVYNVDLRSGASNYEKRSQLISTGGLCEFRCEDIFGSPLPPEPCMPTNLSPGDRPSGIAGVFGGP